MHGCFSLAYSVLTLRTFVVGLEQVEGECIDGEELKLKVPSAAVINEIVTANHKQETSKLGAQFLASFWKVIVWAGGSVEL